MKNLFFDNHKKSYGHFDPQAEIEIVNIRLQAISELKSKKPKIKMFKNKPKPISIEDVWFNNKKSHKTNVFKRSDLPPGFKQFVHGLARDDQVSERKIKKAYHKPTRKIHNNTVQIPMIPY